MQAEEEQGYWWSWGAGTHGQLASGSFQDELLPQRIIRPCTSPSPLLQLACGGSHAVATLRNGEVLSWGNGNSGQLGHDDNQNRCEPALVKDLCSIKICHVSAGWAHTAFVSDDGQVYAAGSQRYGALKASPVYLETSGCESKEPSNIFRLNLFEPLKGHIVRWVAVGAEHSAVVLDDGTVMTWGWGEHGQLGLGTADNHEYPAMVTGVQRMPKSAIYCGCGFTFFVGKHAERAGDSPCEGMHPFVFS